MKYQILIVLFAISLISSAILSLTPVSEICDPGVGCDVVHHSKYNFTFGIQNSHYGIVIFAFMILLTISQLKKPSRFKITLINLGVLAGALIALYFIYLQLFVLNTICKYCMAVDASMIAALLIVIFSWRREGLRWTRR